MIFLLIGQLPNRWKSKKVINRKGNWKLDSYRQIQYIQSSEQKKNLIFKAIQNKYKERFKDWNDFVVNVYWKKCNSNPDELINWLKEEHIDIYCDLF